MERGTKNIKENKMGTMTVNKLLISMSLPMIISMLVQALYNVVDSMFVAQISENALTAVSLAFPLQSLMIAVGVGTGVGVNAVLSKSLGQKDFESAIKGVGAIVENPDMYMYLSGYENLKLVANMYNVPSSRIDEVVKLVKLEGRIKDKVSKYSLGMRQRLGIAQALINSPNLLILDEPTNGLDPEGIKELRDLLKDLAKKENIAVLISSHNLAELDSFCNKVCIIQNGTIIESNEVKKLKKEVSNSTYIFEINNSTLVNNVIDNIKVLDSTHFSIKSKKEEIPSIITKLINNNILIYEVYENKISLEEAFLNKTGGNKID